MADIVGSLPALAGLIEKAGVVGLLLIICAVLGREVWRLRGELTHQYALRDKYRMGFVIAKNECDRNNIKLDLSFMNDILKESAEQN